MRSVCIGIAGGTGVGKSTLCHGLMDVHPGKIGLVQLDDYFKPEDLVPLYDGHKNWDCPEALYLDKLIEDVSILRSGQSVTISTKNERLNPDYATTDRRIPVVFKPKPLLLVEGYLVLHDARLRELLDVSIFLELDHVTRLKRRVHFMYDKYEQEVLVPMHERYVEPTKQFADYVISVSELSAQQVLSKTTELLKEYV
jgi:uridine kinase